MKPTSAQWNQLTSTQGSSMTIKLNIKHVEKSPLESVKVGYLYKRFTTCTNGQTYALVTKVDGERVAYLNFYPDGNFYSNNGWSPKGFKENHVLVSDNVTIGVE